MCRWRAPTLCLGARNPPNHMVGSRVMLRIVSESRYRAPPPLIPEATSSPYKIKIPMINRYNIVRIQNLIKGIGELKRRSAPRSFSVRV
jgi:hypothetical protein